MYLDGGPCADSAQSTIVDLTGSVPRVLRAGVITADQIRKVVPLIEMEPYPGQGSAEPEVKPAQPHPLDGGAEETGS